ncbi:hypothetical protein ACFX13_048123 [Malus domestica]|uniref:Uncharacterized protein n=1 Tax=Malus domestica TaxID=3750 RepID=A0A498J9A7_MALDO|nr:hypothetical protein DVH24_035478 [Malus domestica]
MMKAITKKRTKRISNSANRKNRKTDLTPPVHAASFEFRLLTRFAIAAVVALYRVPSFTLVVGSNGVREDGIDFVQFPFKLIKEKYRKVRFR